MLKWAIVAVATLTASSAFAEIPPHLQKFNIPWSMPQTMHWGDSDQELATNSQVTLDRDRSVDILGLTYGGRAVYTFWGLRTDAQFFFSPLRNALSLIRLKPTDQEKCEALRTEIRSLAPTVIPLRTSALSESEKYYRSMNNTVIEFLTMYRANGSIGGCAILLQPMGT